MTEPHVNDPHEDPAEHIGEVIADPWEDERQTDWVSAPEPTWPS